MDFGWQLFSGPIASEWQKAVSQFKGTFTQARQRIDKQWHDALEREGTQVLNFLANWEPAGRGLIIFSCRPEGLWEMIQLEALVPNLVDIDTTTRTGILSEILEELPHFVVIVQRDKARIYTAGQETAAQQIQIASEVPGQHDRRPFPDAISAAHRVSCRRTPEKGRQQSCEQPSRKQLPQL